MSDFTKEDITIFKRVIENYNTIKAKLDNVIKMGANIKDLKDYIENILNYSTTNSRLENEFLKYVDFNCENMNLSVYEDKNGCYVGDSIEVWDDDTNYMYRYIDTFNNTNEIKAIIKKYEEKESVNNEQ